MIINLDAKLKPSRRSLGPFPPAAPSLPDAPHVDHATIEVDAASAVGPLAPIWRSIGFDEINWTYTRTGKGLLRTLNQLGDESYHVRPHHIFCSGSGFSIPHWGSGNVYHEDADGNPSYDFSILDPTFDAIVDAGHHVLVELGFTPLDLVPDHANEEFTVVASPKAYTEYEAGTWAYPPKDYGKWAALVEEVARHCLERYGAEEVSSWLWELWNEPDGSYWRATVAEFNDLYTATAKAVRTVLPQAKVGGPAVTASGFDFLREFLVGTSERNDPVDFISYHTKGCRFINRREYRPLGVEAAEPLSPSSAKMLFDIVSFNRMIAEFENYRDLPVIIDECDAAVPAHFGRYDNANYQFQNTEYYPVFQAKLMKKILDLNASEVVQVEQATSWSFYFEGERYFEGTRTFLTAGGIEKPLLNAYRMFARLGEERVPATSDAAWSVTDLEQSDGSSMPEEIDALASRDSDGTIALLVWRHTDDQYRADDGVARVELNIKGLDQTGYQLSHWRIDREHSNAHTAWQAVGSPQDPTDEQLESIKKRQGLEEFEPAKAIEPSAGTAVLQLELPLPAVSLIVLTPAH